MNLTMRHIETLSKLIKQMIDLYEDVVSLDKYLQGSQKFISPDALHNRECELEQNKMSLRILIAKYIILSNPVFRHDQPKVTIVNIRL